MSKHFYYFGNRPKSLPSDLMPIVRQGQGHRSTANSPYFERFVQWIQNLGITKNTLMGKPQIDLFSNKSLVDRCAKACCHH